MVASFDVLQCVADDRAALREMARVTRPGGVVVLTLAALEVLSGDHAEVWSEQRRYSPALARQRVEEAGLRLERASFMFGSLFPMMLCARAAAAADAPVPQRARRHRHRRALVSREPGAVDDRASRGGAGGRVPMPFGSSLLVVARKPK